MKNRQVEVTPGVKSLAEGKIQGDAPSPFQIVIAMIPLSQKN